MRGRPHRRRGACRRAAGHRGQHADREVPGACTQGIGIHGTSQLLIDDQRRTIVGATFIGPALAELLHSATVAICGGVTVDQLRHAVPSFPTISEVWLHLGEPRDFLYSKLMCWVALDRAIALAPRLGAEDKVPGLTAVRDEIQVAIMEHGWSQQAGAFTQAFGSEDLDASNLMLAITGFLPGDDPRMKATIDATAERLTDERGMVYRYLAHDGLAGEEGTFLLYTFWLAQAQALAGELDQATATFERAVTAISDVGLLAEEVDAGSGEMIGNFPQVFSHIGLINAAWAIAQAQQRAAAAAAPAGPDHRS